MKIDYTSDTHFDFYIHESKSVTSARVAALVKRFFKFKAKSRGEVLIIAGDIGHYNKQNIDFMRELKAQLGYKAIITVLGNHDRYLISKAQKEKYRNSSNARVAEFKELIANEDGIYLLDGDVVEIDGVKFGGAGGWSDGSYNDIDNKRKQFLFETTMNDFWKITKEKDGFDGSFDYFFQSEYEKLDKVADKVDVMVSHFVPLPSVLDGIEHKSDDLNFYCFDGVELLKKTTAKYWIFGHKHQALEDGKHGVRLLSSPFGYKEQLYIQSIRQIEI